LYLRRLDTQGFKSFADRQIFEFGPGMTVIAGPNGSGKSNVADAIRWALGEQSTRQLRARKTEDIIFSGSEKRRQLGMGEVTIVLDNSEGWMPIDFKEVSVTRRAHRSGDNEYLINNQVVRRSDVLDLFRRAQVGQNSYAHMSQGLVDEVLALRPGERRELIEEAADVRRHRHQLTLSERRLTQTRDNLGHVRMLIAEVEPRLRSLARQSRKAERYQELATELADALQVYLEHELRAARESQTAAQATHDQRGQAFADTRKTLAAAEKRLGDLERIAADRRHSLEQAQTRERELAEEGLRLEQAVALAEQRLELINERRAELQRLLAAEPQVAEEADASIEALLETLTARVAEASDELARHRAALAEADSAARETLRELSEAEATRARLAAERDDARRRLEEIAVEETERRERLSTARERVTTLRGELDEARRTSTELREQQRETELTASDARERRVKAERAIDEAQDHAASAADAERDASAELQLIEDRIALLEKLAETAPSGVSASQAVLDAANEQDPDLALGGVVGLISRLIRVPDGLERAIEAALAEHVAAVVVERREDAIAAVERLREQGSGSALVYPLDGIAHIYPLNLFNERGVIGIAAKLVRTEQRYRPLIDTLLGRVIVVEDQGTAEKMLRRGLGSVVTRDGLLLEPGGAVYGGSGGIAVGQFSLHRELEGLPEQRDAAAEALEAARSRTAAAVAEVARVRAVLASSSAEAEQGASALREIETQLLAAERREGELRAEANGLQRTLEDEDSSAQSAASIRERLSTAERELVTVATRITALRDRSTAVGGERDVAAERVTTATQALADVEAERRALVAQREEREAARQRALELQAQRRTQLDALQREHEDLELSLQDRRGQLANNRSARTSAQEAVGPAHAALSQIEQETRTLSAQRGDAQNAQLTAERELLQSENELRRRQERVSALLEEIAEERMEVQPDGRVTPLPPEPAAVDDAGVDSDEDDDGDEVPDAGAGESTAGEPALVTAAADTNGASEPDPLRGGAEVDIDALRSRITELRGKIHSLGPVNVDALEDLSEERERHEYLTGQIADLEAAEVELRGAIRDLRRLIRERFVETFAVVNERFGEYFTRFFGGGQAELRLVETARDAAGDEEDDDPPEETAEPGVEIFAQPPGKRIASLNVLSGGERAMTSVALLFALLSVNPAPVVVLDEVDAALDEANVGRFVMTLQELQDRSQFIVISHNRRTIEAADAIYGVSMGEDSTSAVLSLKLAELSTAS
jgi:chromosome segregation protein